MPIRGMVEGMVYGFVFIIIRILKEYFPSTGNI